MKRRLQVFVALLLCVGTASAASSQVYRIKSVSITTLAALRGAESDALDINMHGHVVGWNKPASGRKHAFLYYSGAMYDIGQNFSSSETIATGINRFTEVVGYIIPPESAAKHGFYWSAQTAWMVQLDDVLVPEKAKRCIYTSRAEAINDTGYITGSIGFAGKVDPNDPITCVLTPKAALWSTPSNPAVVPGTSDWAHEVGMDINNSNTVAGYSNGDAARWRATGKSLVPPPLNNGSGSGKAYGINAGGTIVGVYEVEIDEDYGPRAFIWDGLSEHSTNLGFLPGGSRSYANDVNPQDFVVGYADQVVLVSVSPLLFSIRNAGFLWHADFGMVALPRLAGAGECQANAVNRRNSEGLLQVVGFCIDNVGLRRAVRWDVVTELFSRYEP